MTDEERRILILKGRQLGFSETRMRQVEAMTGTSVFKRKLATICTYCGADDPPDNRCPCITRDM